MADEPCRICTTRAPDYPRHGICGECRSRAAEVALNSSADLIETLWLVSHKFADRRAQLLVIDRDRLDRPGPDVVASVARGLLEQGYVDDGLVLAAIAIRGGDSADVNQVGASALGVMLDPLLARPGIAATLRVALYGP